MAQNEAAAKEKQLKAIIKEVLRKNGPDLTSLMEVAPPLSVGEDFVAAGIVSGVALRNIQHRPSPEFASQLFFSAKTALGVDNSKFYAFLSILFSYEPCVKLASKMCEELKERGFPDYMKLVPISSAGEAQAHVQTVAKLDTPRSVPEATLSLPPGQEPLTCTLGNSPSSDIEESARFASRLLQKFSEPIAQAIVAPDVLAEKLHRKRLILYSDYQAAITQSRHGKDRCEELLEEVRYKIRHKFVSFEDFLETLQELPRVGTLPGIISSLQEEFEKQGSSPSAQPEQVQPPPVQSPDSLAREPVKFEVQLAARRPFERIRGKFLALTGDFLSAMKKKVTENEIELASLKVHFTFREPDHEEKFNEAKSVDDLVKVILKDCYFTNPDLLESLTLEFKLHELQKEVEQYQSDLEDYCAQVLAEDFVKECLDKYDDDANIEVHFVVRWAKESHLSQFESLLRLVFWKAKKYLTLRAVRNSDLTFLCTAPRWMKDALQRMVTILGESVLISVGVIQVKIEGKPVFLEKTPSSVPSTDRVAILSKGWSQTLRSSAISYKDKIALLQEQMHEHYSVMMADISQQLESEKKTSEALREKMSVMLPRQVEVYFTADIEMNVSQLKSELVDRKKMSHAMTEQIEKMKQELRDHQDKNSLLNEEISLLKTALKQKEDELDECRKMVHLKTVEIEEMKKTPVTKPSVDKVQGSVVPEEDEIHVAKLEAVLADTTQQLEEEKKTSVSFQEKLNTLQPQVEELEKKVSLLETLIQKKDTELEDYSNKFQALTVERDTLTKALKEKEDQPIKQWSANPELIAAIARIQPKSSPEGVVPSSLPDHLKAKLPNVTSEELKGLYNIQKGVSMVNEGSLRPQDLVALHIRSYRKILEMENPQESPIRLRRVFSSIFHDVLNELRGHQRLSPEEYLTELVQQSA